MTTKYEDIISENDAARIRNIADFDKKFRESLKVLNNMETAYSYIKAGHANGFQLKSPFCLALDEGHTTKELLMAGLQLKISKLIERLKDDYQAMHLS